MGNEIHMSDNSAQFVLITGGAGFLGSNIVRAILNDRRYDDLQILVIDDLSGGFSDNLPTDPRLHFQQTSIIDSPEIDRIFAENNIRYVFHLAAYAAEGLSHFIRIS